MVTFVTRLQDDKIVSMKVMALVMSVKNLFTQRLCCATIHNGTDDD